MAADSEWQQTWSLVFEGTFQRVTSLHLHCAKFSNHCFPLCDFSITGVVTSWICWGYCALVPQKKGISKCSHLRL